MISVLHLLLITYPSACSTSRSVRHRAAEGLPARRSAPPRQRGQRRPASARRRISEAAESPSQKAGRDMRYPKRRGRLSVPGRVQLATAAMLLLATTVAACGGDGQDADAK